MGAWAFASFVWLVGFVWVGDRLFLLVRLEQSAQLREVQVFAAAVGVTYKERERVALSRSMREQYTARDTALDHAVAKLAHDVRECRRTRLDDTPRQVIVIDDPCATFGKTLGCRGLASGDSAGQPNA